MDKLTEKLARIISAVAPGVAFSLIIYDPKEDGIESHYVSNLLEETTAPVLADLAKKLQSETDKTLN